MHGGNKLQIGLFGANCSSGRAVTLVPERWSGSWPDVAAQIADLSKAGLTGIAISLVNYLDELPYFIDEVMGRLERMGLRERIVSG